MFSGGIKIRNGQKWVNVIDVYRRLNNATGLVQTSYRRVTNIEMTSCVYWDRGMTYV